MKYRVGLSCGGFGKELCEETFRQCANAGIEAMEISVEKTKYGSIPYEDLAKWSNIYGVELWSMHMPFSVSMKIDISSKDREVREGTVAYFKELIEKAATAGIRRFVVHPSCEPIAKEEREELLRNSCESLKQLADFAARYDAVIAVENLPRTCLGRNSDEMLRLLGADERLGMCFDTNHVLKEDVVAFAKRIAHRVVTLHVSDCDFENERHWLPGEGSVDFQGILKVLEEVNYTGVWLYEIGLKTPDNIKRERDLTFSDFMENAKNLLG